MSDLVAILRCAPWTEVGKLRHEIADEVARLQAVVDAARDRDSWAQHLIEYAVRIMNANQVGQWEGVRAWQEDTEFDDSLRALDGEPCPDCADGIAPKGGNEGSTRYICPTCGGRGYFRHENWKPCPTCGGSGYLPTDTPHTDRDCPTCGGTGRYGDPQHGHGMDCPTCGGAKKLGEYFITDDFTGEELTRSVIDCPDCTGLDG